VSLSYPAIAVAAFSGSHAAPFDQENQNNGVAATIQPGSITPAQDNELIISGFTPEGAMGGPASINEGMTIADQIDATGGSNVGIAIAYKTQTTAAAINPTWTVFASALTCAAVIASFKKA
jgi:hypothetical protein